MTNPVPLACALAGFDAATARRYQELRAAMRTAAVARQELPDGYGIRFMPDPLVFTQLAEWITLERVCCPFLAFALEWSAPDGVWLKLTGAPDVKRFVGERLLE